LFNIKPTARRAYAPEGHAKKITAGICIIFRELFFEHNPRGIDSAFHGAGAEIGQKEHLWMDTKLTCAFLLLKVSIQNA
jgi:hypothetical protein